MDGETPNEEVKEGVELSTADQGTPDVPQAAENQCKHNGNVMVTEWQFGGQNMNDTQSHEFSPQIRRATEVICLDCWTFHRLQRN